METYYFIKLAILHHHCVDDPQETLVRWEYRDSTSQCIPLHEALTDVLAQQLNRSTTPGVRKLIPLEVSPRMVKYCIELIADQLVR